MLDCFERRWSGDNYAVAIVNAIQNCRITLLLLSAAANESPHVANEIERAVNYRKEIIPVRLGKVPPSGLSNFTWQAGNG
jgi:hypothetical protein